MSIDTHFHNVCQYANLRAEAAEICLTSLTIILITQVKGHGLHKFGLYSTIFLDILLMFANKTI